jgi:hypothetical protein
MKGFFEFIGKTAIAITVFLIEATVNGYVLVTLWKWFMVPTFKLAPLTTAQALGLALLISFLTRQDMSNIKKTDEDRDLTTILFTSLIKTLMWAGLTLLIGKIYLIWF